ncbi:hypothetical protein GCM10008969_03370 [Pseudomonas veronii subsp. inensis]
MPNWGAVENTPALCKRSATIRFCVTWANVLGAIWLWDANTLSPDWPVIRVEMSLKLSRTDLGAGLGLAGTAGGRSEGAEDDATLGAREGAMDGRLNTVDGNRPGIRIIFTLMMDGTGGS